MKQLFSYAILTIIIGSVITSCTSDKTKNQSFSLQQLGNNKYNQLQLSVEENPQLLVLNQELEKMDLEAIEARLQEKGLGLFEASYAFAVLGLRYFQKDDFEKGMYYHHLAADQYLNPIAMVRLARIYSESTESVKAKFPEGAVKDFEQDFQKVYHYLHYALNMSILTMEHFQDRYPAGEVNHVGGPLITRFEKKDSSFLGNFDVHAAEENMKAELPAIQALFNKTYQKASKIQ